MELFDIVLFEKPGDIGLTKIEVMDLFDMLADTEAYPVEIVNPAGESSAMGFITTAAADMCNYEYLAVNDVTTENNLGGFIQCILADMTNETEDGFYLWNGIRIYLSR